MERSRTTKIFKLSQTHIKILDTVNNLNALHAYPTVDGVGKILRGDLDEETLPYKDTSTFATLISLKGRRLASLVLMLVRYRFLKNRYDEDTNEYYLEMTFHGIDSLESFKLKHKLNYKKKTKTIKKTILVLK